MQINQFFVIVYIIFLVGFERGHTIKDPTFFT